MKVAYHPAKFGAHKHSDSEAIVVLVFHVISQDHMIKRSCDLMGRITSR